VAGFIVKEACPYPSSWRGAVTLDAYLKRHGIVGIQGIDTRALTRHLRDRGAQEGIISSVEMDVRRLTDRARALPGMAGRDLVSEVTVDAPHGWSEGTWDLARGYTAPPAPRHASSPSIRASSTISSAGSPASAARSR
jgi:carbamoyl-phosphate synthase small subunit